jgi:hypothetical protein
MGEDVSLVTKRRDYADVVKLQEVSALEEFLEQPLTAIAETLTGALGDGAKGMWLAGGRIVQSILKGKIFQQFASEFRNLREKGRIPDGFADRKYGFQSWVELMTILDEESPDPDRLEALKAMFFAVNRVNVTDGEQVAAYQMWQVAKRLNSGELLLLKLVYEQRTSYQTDNSNSYLRWENEMAEAAGHSVRGLIGLNEKKLTDLGLLTPRQWADGSGINPANARLTEFGFAFCNNIEKYRVEIKSFEDNE